MGRRGSSWLFLPDMKIRLSAELRRQVENAAKENNRTLNSEIVSRLERTFREDAKGGPAKEATPPNYEKWLSSLEAAVLGMIVELSEVKEKLGM